MLQSGVSQGLSIHMDIGSLSELLLLGIIAQIPIGIWVTYGGRLTTAISLTEYRGLMCVVQNIISNRSRTNLIIQVESVGEESFHNPWN